MTREKEIRENAIKCYHKTLDEVDVMNHTPMESLTDGIVYGFIEGAKWADETMIEKVCKWLKENIDAYSTVTIKENSIPAIVLTEDFERILKKL